MVNRLKDEEYSSGKAQTGKLWNHSSIQLYKLLPRISFKNLQKYLQKKTGFLIWISSIFCKPKWLNLTDYHIYYIYCLFIYFYTICIFKKFHDFCFGFYFIHGIFPICHLIFITYWWKALFNNKGKTRKKSF